MTENLHQSANGQKKDGRLFVFKLKRTSLFCISLEIYMLIFVNIPSLYLHLVVIDYQLK